MGIGSSNEQALNYTLGFVIGNFLFIALVEMFGFLNKEKKKKLYLFKCLGFILGIGSMYVILVIEEQMEKVGGGDEPENVVDNSTLLNSTLNDTGRMLLDSTRRFLKF